jgi:L-lysine exporter family protein LysE/ArgO
MYILIAIVIGFIAAIPFGPINVYAISQTLKRDFLHGYLVGMTSAVCDFFFCMISITGMYKLASSLSSLQLLMKIFGILVLVAISARLMHQAHHFELERPKQKKLTTTPRPVIATLLLYFTNPSLYAFWLAVGGTVTAHGIVSTSDNTGILFAAFCSVGTLIWYLILCRYVSHYHHQFKQSTFKKILFGTALILLGLALYTTVSLFL